MSKESKHKERGTKAFVWDYFDTDKEEDKVVCHQWKAALGIVNTSKYKHLLGETLLSSLSDPLQKDLPGNTTANEK